MLRTHLIWATLMMAAVAMLVGCASTGIAIRESLGMPKREQLVSRVKDSQSEQAKAKDQFASTLDEFQALTAHDGGDLERLYRRLDRQLDRSRSQASSVSKKIGDVDRVGNALFKEWEAELKSYSSDDLRRTSQQQLLDSRARFDELLRSMRRAEASMEPVLTAFNDQVLFLKHNLNASAVASLGSSVLPGIETDVARLIAEMEASIAESDAFIRTMSGA